MKVDPEELKGMPREELIKHIILPLVEKISKYEQTYISREHLAERWDKSLSYIDKCRAAGKLTPLKHDEAKIRSSVSFPLPEIVKYEQTRLRMRNRNEE